MTENLEQQTLQCPGCSYMYTVEVEDEMYELFENIESIEGNILEGEVTFHCWDCMQKVEAGTAVALLEFIDAPVDEVKEVVMEKRAEAEPPHFTEELTEEDREMVETKDASLFSSLDRSYSE